MSQRKTLMQWLAHIAAAPDGTNLEVGLMYDSENGWRVYQRLGDKALALDPEGARKMAAAYDKIGSQPEWRDIKTGLESTLGDLRSLAAEADQKNAAGEIPPSVQ